MADYTAIDLGRLLNDSLQQELTDAATKAATEAVTESATKAATDAATLAATSAVLQQFSAQQAAGSGGMILGKVGLTPAGTWNAGRSYERLDFVLSGGGSYVSKHDDNQGHAVTSGDWWQPLALPAGLTELEEKQSKAEEAIAALQKRLEAHEEEAQTAADALSDFLDNEKITAAGYDAATRTLSLVRGEQDTTSLAPLTVTLPVATEEEAGLMGAADKRELHETSRWYESE